MGGGHPEGGELHHLLLWGGQSGVAQAAGDSGSGGGGGVVRDILLKYGAYINKTQYFRLRLSYEVDILRELRVSG